MKLFDNLTFARKQLLLGVTLAGVSFLLIVATQIASRDYLIGGKCFKEIQSSCDLVADILPPPVYVIELYLASTELVNAKTDERRQQLLSDIDRLQLEFEQRLQHWKTNLSAGELKSSLEESGDAARKLMVVLNSHVIPYMKDNKVFEAREYFEEHGSRLFEAHREAIGKTVPIAFANQKSIASMSAAKTASSWQFTLVVATIFLGISTIVFWQLGRQLSRRILVLQRAASEMASGDISGNYQSSATDEIGNTCRSYQEVKITLESVTSDLQFLVRSANQGDLSVRVDEEKYHGIYRELVHGLNKTLEAVNAPIDEAVDVLGSVSNRDLSQRMTGHYAGQFEKIKSSLNNALDCLNESLSQVALGAEQVNSASYEIANGSQSLAHGASNQASTLAAITHSLEGIATATKQGTNNVAVGRSLAAHSLSSVQRGNEAMTLMSKSIDKIKKSSDATAKIVKTIDDLAFQTNLLALNAAVEAARAGDAGKGFAVVAEEVRNLAQRSASAAKNTSELIAESVKNSEDGVAITMQMGVVLDEISENTRKVNVVISEIADGAVVQSQGIDEVNQAITKLDKITQESAAHSEESASAGEQLSAQASSLANTVGAFSLSKHSQPRSVIPRECPNESNPNKSRFSTKPQPVHTHRNVALVALDANDFNGF